MNSADIDAIKRIESRDYFARLAPSLAIGERTRFNGFYGAAASAPVSAQAQTQFESDGWFSLASAIPHADVAAMREAILALEAAGVPALFAYVYDAFWQCLDAVAPRVAHLVGPVEALPDVWAWYLAQGASVKGWQPHRGSYTREVTSDGKPALINVWIPLTDVDERNACMWVVPRSQDNRYPHALEKLDAISSGAPLVASAGTLLGWDANVLHWGGDMTPTAASPRISFSFTLRAVGTSSTNAPPLTDKLDFQARLALIAEMISIYGDQATPLPALVTRWATFRRDLSNLAYGHRAVAI